MSKFDLLTEQETATAHSQGWTLCDVFDLTKKQWHRQILPLQFSKTWPHSQHATAQVIHRARHGDPVALRALQLISQGHKDAPHHRRPK